MPASSKDAVRRAEQPLASAGNTDGAILPGVYEGFGEGLQLCSNGTSLFREEVKVSIRIELVADGTFVRTETVDGKPWLTKGVYGVTTAGVDFTPEGENKYSLPVVKGAFQCRVGIGSEHTLSLERVP